MSDYRLPSWKLKQLKKCHKTLKQKHEADRIKAVVLLAAAGLRPKLPKPY